MKPNLSDKARLLRTLIGVYAMLLGFLFIQGVVGIIIGVLGLMLLATGLTGWCGIYALLKMNTAPVAEKKVE